MLFSSKKYLLFLCFNRLSDFCCKSPLIRGCFQLKTGRPRYEACCKSPLIRGFLQCLSGLSGSVHWFMGSPIGRDLYQYLLKSRSAAILSFGLRHFGCSEVVKETPLAATFSVDIKCCCFYCKSQFS